jgi:hypothetical protein
MASLRITEYEQLGEVPGGFRVPAGVEPATAKQAVTFTTSVASAAFNNRTNFVRIHTDSICAIEFGTAPTAVAGTGTRMVAGQTEFFALNPSFRGTLKVAAVTDT